MSQAGIGDLTTDTGESADAGGGDETVELYVTTTEYTEEGGKPITHVFGRDENLNPWHIEVEGHRPSFFVKETEFGPKITNHYAVHSHSRYDGDGERYLDVNGNPLVRVYTYLPGQVSDLREHFDTSYEADVFYTNRWLIDNEIYTGIEVAVGEDQLEDREGWGKDGANRVERVRVDVGDVDPCEPPVESPRLIITDIEVASEAGMPDKSEARWPVSTIVAYDSYEDDYIGWLLTREEHYPLPQDTRTSPWNDTGLDEWRTFDDESELLDDYNQYIVDRGPDMLSGWYSDDFDYPYLINRCRNLNVWSFKDWSPVGDVYTTNYGPVVKGIETFDMLDGYDKTKRGEYSGKLEDVAQEELGRGKEDVEESHTEMWKQDPVTFLRYNKVDVELVKEIEAERGIINLYNNLRELTGAQFDDCHTNIDLLDVLFLRKGKKYGKRLPTATENARSWYYGAKVLDPQPGIHENAIYFDLASLYPMSMLQLNIGTDTMVGLEDDYDGRTVHSYVDTRPESVKRETEPDLDPIYYKHPDEEESFIRTFVDDLISLKEPYRGTDMYIPVKQVTNCFTPDTEVMTPNGVVGIRDLDVGDDVYSIDPETMDVEVKPVEKVWKYPSYDDELVSIENTVTDLTVTPNHRILTKKHRYDDDYEWVTAGDLNEWTEYQLPNEWNIEHGDELKKINLADLTDNYEVKIDTDVHGRTLQGAVDWDLEYAGSGYYIVDSDTYEEYRETLHNLLDDEDFFIHGERYEAWTPLVWDGDDFIEFIGWYITEGSQYTTTEKHYENGHHRGESTKISISQYETGDGHVDDIETVVDSIGLQYRYDGNSYEITGSKVVAEILEELSGSGAYEKKIPDMLFDVSERQKQLLFDTMMAGDGDTHSGNRYTTVSDNLRDDFMKLSLHLGMQPRYNWEGGETRFGDGVWRVRPIDSNNTVEMSSHGNTEVADSGVYSVTVEDNHTVLAGRNGKFQFVGQSIYGVLSDGDSYGKGFRLFDWQLGESITMMGRKVLQFSQEKIIEKFDERGYDANAAGGDTDSVVVSVPGAEDQHELLDVAHEIAEEVNGEYADFTHEEFGTDENFMEIEVESLADKLFIPHGATTKTPKKRYAQKIIWDDDALEPCAKHGGSDAETIFECEDCKDGWGADKTKITGLEYVRSDTAGATNEAQKRFVDEILSKPLGEAKESYYAWLNDYVTDLREGDEPVRKLARPKGIGQPLDQYGTATDKPQPTYKGAKYANEFIYGGAKIVEGDKPVMYYVDEIGGDYPVRFPHSWDTGEAGTKVDAVTLDDADDLPDEIGVDIEKMIDKTLRVPLGRMFAPLGWSMDEALSDTDQTDLAKYF